LLTEYLSVVLYNFVQFFKVWKVYNSPFCALNIVGKY